MAKHNCLGMPIYNYIPNPTYPETLKVLRPGTVKRRVTLGRDFQIGRYGRTVLNQRAGDKGSRCSACGEDVK